MTNAKKPTAAMDDPKWLAAVGAAIARAVGDQGFELSPPQALYVAMQAADAMRALEPAAPVEDGEAAEMVAAQIKADPTEEPTMPGLSGHFPEMNYHGAAQYSVECACGFKTKPANFYIAKAEWAEHAASRLASQPPAADALGALTALIRYSWTAWKAGEVRADEALDAIFDAAADARAALAKLQGVGNVSG